MKTTKTTKSILMTAVAALFLAFGVITFSVTPKSVDARPINIATSTINQFSVTSKEAVCDQLKELDDKNCDSDNVGILNSIIKPVIQILIIIIGGVSVLVIVIAGLMFVLSAGNPEQTKRARDAVLYAVIGLIVALLAQAIISFVIGAIG